MIFLRKTTFLLALLLPLSGLASTSDEYNILKADQQHSKTTAEIVNRLKHQHYQRTSIFLNDNLSSTVLDRYLKELDRDRSYFIAADIREFEAYRFRLDDAFKTGNLNPAFNIFNRYQQRIAERLDYTLELLNKGINKLDFTNNEKLILDRKNMPWAKSTQQLDKL